jgi:hypothetical protein
LPVSNKYLAVTPKSNAKEKSNNKKMKNRAWKKKSALIDRRLRQRRITDFMGKKRSA